MKLQPSSVGAKDRLAQIVEQAAREANCPVAVFYLCGRKQFEVAATFGCSLGDAGTNSGLSVLKAAKAQPEGIIILDDVALDHSLRSGQPWLFSEGTGPARFLAAVHVAFEQLPSCGLLLVADHVPHAPLSTVQQYLMRANSARISEMLENYVHHSRWQQADETRIRLLDTVAKRADEAIIITEADRLRSPLHRIIFCNPAFNRLTGYEETDLLGLSPDVLCADWASSHSVINLENALLRRRTVALSVELRRRNGTEFSADICLVPEPELDNDITCWFVIPHEGRNSGVIENHHRRATTVEAENIMLEQEKAALEAEIQERKRIEARLHYLAYHDNLTSVYNRQFFIDKLTAALERQSEDKTFCFAVLLLDLDRFKLVNDSFGHRAGDLMLIEIAERLAKSTRADDVVARLGGDEFAILVQGFDKPSFVASMAERVVEVLRYPILLAGEEVFSSASIGLAIATKYYRLPDEILRDADIAMYEAKRRRAGALVFDDSMQHDVVVSSKLRAELHHAVTRSEFYVEYQPIFNLATREIKGMEALIRWQHPVRGKLLPSAFIGTAEEIGLIRQIGAYVLREACTQMQGWHHAYPDLGLRLSVNVSGHELTDVRFVSQLSEILSGTGLKPDALQLEVTESVLFPSSEPIVTVLRDAKALGVRLVLDDFGTGYSSLRYLDRYQIDGIKIDQPFVAGTPERKSTFAIVNAIIELAQALNLEVTAEGIEHNAQIQALLSMGCTHAQGFFLSKPLSAIAVGHLLHKSAKWK